jgi:hypothetical protein
MPIGSMVQAEYIYKKTEFLILRAFKKRNKTSGIFMMNDP